MKKFWRIILLILLLGILIWISNSCAPTKFVDKSWPQTFSDDYRIKKSSTFLNDVEIRIDSLIIPAKTVGKGRELVYDGKGGVNRVIVDFSVDNKVFALSFVKKELVERRTKNPKDFILDGKVYGFNTLASIPREAGECTLLFQP